MNQNDCQSIAFSSSDFINFINFVRSMNSKDKSKYSKVILLHVENNQLVCRAIDDSSNYIEYYVELYHTDNIITEYIVVSVMDILALVKCASGDKFLIRKNFNQYEFNVIGGGWLPFNLNDIDCDKYSISNNKVLLGEVDANKLHEAIASVLNYTQEYTYARDKYITFKQDKMFVTSRLSGVTTRGSFIEMVLHRDDAARLKLLLKCCSSVKISSIAAEVEQLCFESDKFKFIINCSDIATSDNSYDGAIENYITINCEELYKLALFAEEYSASKHLIGLAIKDGKFIASVKNTLGANHVSIINSKLHGNITNTHEAVAKARNILRALKIFLDKHAKEINIYISDELLADQNSIIIFDDNTQAIINIIQ